MGRVVRDWKPNRVEDATVAPHRYTWDGANSSDPYAKTFNEWKASIPYHDGEVVYVDRGGKAVKTLIYATMTTFRDRFGDRREAYKIQVETAAGTWSKLWEITYSGFIQRGYKLAGLAPDVPD